MAKLADAADLKSAGPKGLWGFDSPSRHQLDCGIVSGRSGTRKMEHLLANPQRDSAYTLLLHLKALGIVNVLPEKSDSTALAGLRRRGCERRRNHSRTVARIAGIPARPADETVVLVAHLRVERVEPHDLPKSNIQ